MSKKKIAIISYPFLSFKGGAERYVEQLYQALVDVGVNVDIYSSYNFLTNKVDSRLDKNDVKPVPNFPFIKRFKYKHEMLFNYLVSFLYKKDLRRYDLILPQAVGAFYILNNTELCNLSAVVSYNSPWPRYSSEEKEIYAKAKNIICINQACKRSILNNYPSICKDKLHVFNNGVDINKFYPVSEKKKKKIKQKYNIPKNSLFLLTLQRMDSRKDLDLLIALVKRVAKFNSNSVFVGVGGGGPKKDLIESKIKQADLDNLKTLGFIEEKDLSMIYSAADVFLSASWGQVALEAMASGTCTFVINDHYACKEYVSNPYFLLEPKKSSYSKISEFLKKPDKIKQHNHASRIYIKKNFDWKNVAENILKTFIS